MVKWIGFENGSLVNIKCITLFDWTEYFCISTLLECNKRNLLTLMLDWNELGIMLFDTQVKLPIDKVAKFLRVITKTLSNESQSHCGYSQREYNVKIESLSQK